MKELICNDCKNTTIDEDKEGCVCNKCKRGIFKPIEEPKLIKIEDFKCRTCDECKKGMNEGYCIGGGEEYYCSSKCLHKHYTPEQWEDMYNSDYGYWTEWDIEEEYKEYLENL